MIKRKFIKGEYEYPAYQTKFVILRTICYFLLALAVFLLGIISTKTKENLLTVVAVCGLLPACKSLVSVIMYLRIPKFREDIYQTISAKIGSVSALYSMYLTSYKLNFPINCFGVRGNNLIGYTEFSTCDTAACEEHIKILLQQNGMKNITIKIFKDQKKFEDRLKQMQGLDTNHKEEEILALLCDISL